MYNFPEKIRELREAKKIPLRTVAAYLDIDQAILSKIERGKRKATRKIVVKLAAYFQLNEEDLLVAWLSDKLFNEVADEQLALKALQVAEEIVAFKTSVQTATNRVAERLRISVLIQQYFQSQNLISKAWLFGSYARGDYSVSSDVDVLIDVPSERKFTLFDISEVQEELQKKLNIKVDVVMLNGLRPEIKERIKEEMQLIYEI
jgi:predicted nucleotidyltransferase/plasmid maintenance system antidote protein VapI